MSQPEYLVRGFCVINPKGRPMIAETFSVDEAKSRARFDRKNYSTMLWCDCVKAGYRMGVVTVLVEVKE